MESFIAQLGRHSQKIDIALETAENTKPELYGMVCAEPTLKSVTTLLNGIVTDFKLTTLITKYLIAVK